MLVQVAANSLECANAAPCSRYLGYLRVGDEPYHSSFLQCRSRPWFVEPLGVSAWWSHETKARIKDNSGLPLNIAHRFQLPDDTIRLPDEGVLPSVIDQLSRYFIDSLGETTALKFRS